MAKLTSHFTFQKILYIYFFIQFIPGIISFLPDDTSLGSFVRVGRGIPELGYVTLHMPIDLSEIFRIMDISANKGLKSDNDLIRLNILSSMYDMEKAMDAFFPEIGKKADMTRKRHRRAPPSIPMMYPPIRVSSGGSSMYATALSASRFRGSYSAMGRRPHSPPSRGRVPSSSRRAAAAGRGRSQQRTGAGDAASRRSSSSSSSDVSSFTRASSRGPRKPLSGRYGGKSSTQKVPKTPEQIKQKRQERIQWWKGFGSSMLASAIQSFAYGAFAMSGQYVMQSVLYSTIGIPGIEYYDPKYVTENGTISYPKYEFSTENALRTDNEYSDGTIPFQYVSPYHSLSASFNQKTISEYDVVDTDPILTFEPRNSIKSLTSDRKKRSIEEDITFNSSSEYTFNPILDPIKYDNYEYDELVFRPRMEPFSRPISKIRQKKRSIKNVIKHKFRELFGDVVGQIVESFYASKSIFSINILKRFNVKNVMYSLGKALAQTLRSEEEDKAILDSVLLMQKISSSLVKTLESLQAQKIPFHLFDATQTAAMLARIQKRLTPLNYKLLAQRPSELKLQACTHTVIDNILDIQMHIPIVYTELDFTLYKWIPTPTSSFNEYLQIKPEKNILAFNRIKQTFKAISADALSSCKRVGQEVFVCSELNSGYKYPAAVSGNFKIDGVHADSCLISLFIGSLHETVDSCSMTVDGRRGDGYLQAGNELVLMPESVIGNTICIGDTQAVPQNVGDNTIIKIAEGCIFESEVFIAASMVPGSIVQHIQSPLTWTRLYPELDITDTDISFMLQNNYLPTKKAMRNMFLKKINIGN